jgi:hypothetical protein
MKPLRQPAGLLDVLDRVLDKGIVLDVWPRSDEGIDLSQAHEPTVETADAAYLRGVTAGVAVVSGQAAPVAPPVAGRVRLVATVQMVDTD